MRQLRVGRIDIVLLDDGRFRLDGGGMFGVVPRSIWEKHMPPDGRNRIELGLTCPLITSAGRRVLVDTGVGRKQSARLQEIFAVDTQRTLLHALVDAGVGLDQIDVVTNTHLHFDHSGWNTRHDAGGNVVPTFPRAAYVFQKREWDVAREPDERSQPAYPRENFAPLTAARALDLVDGEVELATGVFTLPTPGHTCGHQCVRIESDGEVAVFLGDLIPTPEHIPVHYHMAYDLEPLTLMAKKRDVLEQAARDGWLLLFDHDPRARVGRVEVDAGRFSFREIPGH
jgi:glyoxylase-like metal-dependent hydrolase (beta-lactamase superfamily II)